DEGQTPPPDVDEHGHRDLHGHLALLVDLPLAAGESVASHLADLAGTVSREHRGEVGIATSHPTDVVGDGVAVRRGDDLPARHLAFVDGPVDVGTVSGGRLQQCGQSDVEGVFGGVFQQDLGAAGEGAVEIDQFRLGSGGSAGGFEQDLDHEVENENGGGGDYDPVKHVLHRLAGEKAIAEG